MKGFGMRQPEPRHPELFVEADGVDHQGIAFPIPDGVAQKTWVYLIRRRMRPPVRVHDTPDMRAAARQDQYTLCFGNFVNQQAVWRVKLSWSAWRQTPRVRITLALLSSPYLIESLRPRHERNFSNI